MNTDDGLLLLRIVLALLLVAHSTQKLFGWFSGQGQAGTSALFEKLGLSPGRPLVILSSSFELLAAISLGVGVLSPLGSVAAAGTLSVAGVTFGIASGKFWNAGGGGEYPYVLAALAVVLAVTGPGAISVDAVIARHLDGWSVFATGTWWHGVIVLAIGVVAAVVFASVIRRHRRAAAQS